MANLFKELLNFSRIELYFQTTVSLDAFFWFCHTSVFLTRDFGGSSSFYRSWSGWILTSDTDLIPWKLQAACRTEPINGIQKWLLLFLYIHYISLCPAICVQCSFQVRIFNAENSISSSRCESNDRLRSDLQTDFGKYFIWLGTNLVV